MDWMDGPDTWDEEFMAHYEERGARSIEEAMEWNYKEWEESKLNEE